MLSRCTNDVILGRDLLQSHEAVIDCANSELWTSFDVFVGIPSPEVNPKLYVREDVFLAPNTTTVLQLFIASELTDDVVVRPNYEPLLRKGLFAPNCVASPSNGSIKLPVANR